MAAKSNPPLPSRTRTSARTLRRAQTDAESKLWYHVRAGRLLGYKFRRQHPLPPYVADLICLDARLVVELDGSQHTEGADRARTEFLERNGFHVLRFWDNDVLNNTEAVLEAIVHALQDRTLTPSPSPEGRGEQGTARDLSPSPMGRGEQGKARDLSPSPTGRGVGERVPTERTRDVPRKTRTFTPGPAPKGRGEQGTVHPSSRDPDRGTWKGNAETAE